VTLVGQPLKATLRGNATASHVLILSLVHPDFLAPLYSISQVLRDHGHFVDLFCFSSPAKGKVELRKGITIHDYGAHAGNALQRYRQRRRLALGARDWMAAHQATAVFASCPFSLLLGLRIAGRRVPVVYISFEVYEPRLTNVFRSPATTVRNWRARRAVSAATVVCAPSEQRARWLQQQAQLSRLPIVLLNAPYGQGASVTHQQRLALRTELVPATLRGKRLVLHTGKVSATQGVLELVESVQHWPDDAALVVTRMASDDYCWAVRDSAAKSVRRTDIALLPMLSREDMLALQSISDIGVCLLREGTNLTTDLPAPNKVGEYLHAGLFVVGTQSAFLAELERRGIALSVTSLNPEAVARGVSEALERVAKADWPSKVRDQVNRWYRMEVQLEPVVSALGLSS